MAGKRDKTQTLIMKYKSEIAHLEEQEEDIARRIQIMENMVPTVLIWYMWKISQAKKNVPFPQGMTEEEAQNKLLNLERILDELQEAESVLKEEENILRQRIDELENSLKEDGGVFRSDSRIDALGDEGGLAIEKEISDRAKKMREMEKEQMKLKDLVEDANTDWQKSCEELKDQVDNIAENLNETKDKLVSSEKYVSKLEQDLQSRDENFGEKELHRQSEPRHFSKETVIIEKEPVEDHSNIQDQAKEEVTASIKIKEEQDVLGTAGTSETKEKVVTEEKAEDMIKKEKDSEMKEDDNLVTVADESDLIKTELQDLVDAKLESETKQAKENTSPNRVGEKKSMTVEDIRVKTEGKDEEAKAKDIAPDATTSEKENKSSRKSDDSVVLIPPSIPLIVVSDSEEANDQPELQPENKSPLENTAQLDEKEERPVIFDGSAAGTPEAQVITSEPFDVSEDKLERTPSGLVFEKEAGGLKARPSVESLTTQTLKSKCREKDHLIKSMADQLRELAKKNVWSGSKLLEKTSADPVKTYDFNRTTLFQYLKAK